MTTVSVMVRPQGFALFKEGCMLRGIEEARFWIPMHFLPATDGGAGRCFEPTAGPSAKPQRAKPALDIAV